MTLMLPILITPSSTCTVSSLILNIADSYQNVNYIRKFKNSALKKKVKRHEKLPTIIEDDKSVGGEQSNEQPEEEHTPGQEELSKEQEEDKSKEEKEEVDSSVESCELSTEENTKDDQPTGVDLNKSKYNLDKSIRVNHIFLYSVVSSSAK